MVLTIFLYRLQDRHGQFCAQSSGQPQIYARLPNQKNISVSSLGPFYNLPTGVFRFTTMLEFCFVAWGAHADRYDRATDQKQIIDP